MLSRQLRFVPDLSSTSTTVLEHILIFLKFNRMNREIKHSVICPGKMFDPPPKTFFGSS